MQALVDARAKLEATDNNGVTPLMYAAKDGTAEVVQALVDAGAKLEATDNDGMTPLMNAAAYGTAETLQALVEACRATLRSSGRPASARARR